MSRTLKQPQQQTSCGREVLGDLLGGPVAKNPPASAGDTSWIPGLGTSSVRRGSQAREPQVLSLCWSPGAAISELRGRELVLCHKRSHASGSPPHCGEAPAQPRTNKYFFKKERCFGSCKLKRKVWRSPPHLLPLREQSFPQYQHSPAKWFVC